MIRSARNLQFFPVPSLAETRHFLASDMPADDDLMFELWNKSSGAPGLLRARRAGAVPIRAAGEKDYIYDPVGRVYRYASTGRAVSRRQLTQYVRRTVRETRNRMRKETQQMLAGTILFVVWYYRIRSLMKAIYRAIWIVWIGGILFYDDTERNLFYLFCLLQFNRLDDFKAQIESGKQALNGRAVTRAGLYAGWGNGMWQNLALERAIRDGKTEARRVLGENENHCRDSKERHGCVELAELGWMQITQMTPIGEATCYSNCLCQIETR